MSEFFLELFSEEIPSNLQKNIREDLLKSFNNLFIEKSIAFKKSSSYSTPNRLIILFEGIQKKVLIKAAEIKGPNVKSPEIALNGFMKSNKISKKDLYEKETDKGNFYFYKTKLKKLNTHQILVEFLPILLHKIQWNKSMYWGNYDLLWGRPLKSILAIFNKKKLKFNFHHLESSNSTFIDKEFEEKNKIFTDYRSYKNFFKKLDTIIDQNERRTLIEQKFDKILKNKNINIDHNPKLLDEVVNLTDQPNVIVCEFDKKFLNIPKEILIITMQHHQKYFPTFDKKGDITNEFLVVANKKDIKGFIKLGNERVVEARLSDAEFFWNKDKSQNLVKKVSELKSMNFFKGLGTYFDKVQRMRKLGGLISDQLFISKEKVELSASICKTDLISDSVGEFPELQGVMGSYLSSAQGFDNDVVEAIREQYLPLGLRSTVPKKPYSVALSLTDKIDTLTGFFGVNEKPSSSKDPYALRRVALSIIRLIIENKLDIKLTDLILYSSNFYLDQNLSFPNTQLQKDMINFLKDRFRYYLKEKDIRHDIIEASIKDLNLNKISNIFEKSKCLNKVINKPVGEDIISSYKRAFNILFSEVKNIDKSLPNTTDPGIFKNDFEKNLFKKTEELRKHFSEISKNHNFHETLVLMSNTKKEVFAFFDNVKVNDDNENVKKNRLELINLFCKTCENFINFRLIKDIHE